MDRFLEMRAFVQVVDAGSFIGAAEPLEISKAAVSRYIGELESRLGVRLLHRTTRKLSLTEEGELFYLRCKDILSGVEAAESEVTSRTGEAIGLLRVSAPVSFGIQHLGDAWAEFKARHPKVTFDITLSDRVVDIIEEGFDLAVRISRLQSSSLISRRLASTRMIACASPQYLAKHGKPGHPAEFASHSVIAYSLWAMHDEWEFEGPEGQVKVRTTPCIRTNSGDICRASALAHQGIILQPTFLVGPDLESGALVELCPQYRAMELGIYAIYGSRKHVAPKVRLLIDFLAERLEKKRWPG
ncbi:LysR family transcriptional regulator [Ralstonia solanacearum]|uniref:LysR family transcriptional regulator n=1 Tax=Ralstonia solanacearum TaxID=305 RepID=UPI0018D112B8|nr:LysR family transcriptional regulator [Ralstonia solanacearum]MDB0509517.1 LysR family transcriptional regulator [Ralstonia solanacearum]MDB0515449.1 LysR family transcriptional regulator [Ralstonia solanacearum]